MRKKLEWKWEILDRGVNPRAYSTTARAKVIGGWLVSHIFCLEDKTSESMQFIADKDHEWEIILPPLPTYAEEENSHKDWRSDL